MTPSRASPQNVTHSLRISLRPSILQRPRHQCLNHRTFTTTLQLSGWKTKRPPHNSPDKKEMHQRWREALRSIKSPLGPEKEDLSSPRLMQDEEFKNVEVQTDFGLIPGTFIFPARDATKRPSWFIQQEETKVTLKPEELRTALKPKRLRTTRKPKWLPTWLQLERLQGTLERLQKTPETVKAIWMASKLTLQFVVTNFAKARREGNYRIMFPQTTRDRAYMEIYRFRSFVTALHSLNQYRNIVPAEQRKLHLKVFRPRELAKEAEEAYISVYKAFAAGEISGLDECCVEGLWGALKKRILERRKRNRTVTWSYEQLEEPKLVRHSAQVLPEVMTLKKGTGLRQIVVRLVAKQVLTVKTPVRLGLNAIDDVEAGDNAEAGGKPTRVYVKNGMVVTEYERRVTEYVVCQKMTRGSQEDEQWAVWGTTTESDMDTIASTLDAVEAFMKQNPQKVKGLMGAWD